MLFLYVDVHSFYTVMYYVDSGNQKVFTIYMNSYFKLSFVGMKYGSRLGVTKIFLY